MTSALWLRRLFREKEPLPSTGQALFCFGLILVLSRLSISFGEQLPLMVQMGIRYLAIRGDAASAAVHGRCSSRRNRSGKRWGLRLPAWWAWLAAAVLAVLLYLPGPGICAPHHPDSRSESVADRIRRFAKQRTAGAGRQTGSVFAGASVSDGACGGDVRGVGIFAGASS